MIWHHPPHCSVWDWKIPEVALWSPVGNAPSMDPVLRFVVSESIWWVHCGLGVPKAGGGLPGILQHWGHGSGAASTSFSLIPPLAITCCAQTGKSQFSHPVCVVMRFLIEQQKWKAFPCLCEMVGEKRGVESSFIGIRFSRKSALHPKFSHTGPKQGDITSVCHKSNQTAGRKHTRGCFHNKSCTNFIALSWGRKFGGQVVSWVWLCWGINPCNLYVDVPLGTRVGVGVCVWERESQVRFLFMTHERQKQVYLLASL